MNLNAQWRQKELKKAVKYISILTIRRLREGISVQEDENLLDKIKATRVYCLILRGASYYK